MMHAMRPPCHGPPRKFGAARFGPRNVGRRTAGAGEVGARQSARKRDVRHLRRPRSDPLEIALARIGWCPDIPRHGTVFRDRRRPGFRQRIDPVTSRVGSANRRSPRVRRQCRNYSRRSRRYRAVFPLPGSVHPEDDFGLEDALSPRRPPTQPLRASCAVRCTRRSSARTSWRSLPMESSSPGIARGRRSRAIVTPLLHFV